MTSCNQSVRDNNSAEPLDGAGENIGMIASPARRAFLRKAGVTAAVLVATAGAATRLMTGKAVADGATQIAGLSKDDFADIPYRESKVGIDYHALADFPVDHMLSQGEAEWMENATPVFGDETGEVWEYEMIPEVSSGRVSEFTVEDMKEFTPNMLLSFARLPANHPKYGGIREAGKLFELQRGLIQRGLIRSD